MILLVVVTIMATPGNSETVNRVNFGVIFTKDRTVHAVYEYWTHTFRLKFPKMHDVRNINISCSRHRPRQPEQYEHCRGIQQMVSNLVNISCATHVAIPEEHYQHCVRLQKMISPVNHIRNHYWENMANSINTAMSLMPRPPIPKSRSRSKRGAFDFIGDISHSLFGTATSKEVARVAHHVIQMENKNRRLIASLSKYQDDLSTFMTLSGERFHNLRTMTTDNHAAIDALAQRLQRTTLDLSIDTGMNVMLIKDLYFIMGLQLAVNDFLEGVQELLNHKLSIHIVPYQDIIDVISDINVKLERKQTNLKVKTMSSNEIYTSVPFLWTYVNGSLYVSLKFPLVATMAELDVYRIYKHPVPLNDSTGHATELKDTHEYVAFSTDQKYYCFPQQFMFKDSLLDAQSNNLPLYHMTHPHCVTALFFNNKQNIHQYCDFRVKLDHITPTVTHVHHGKYLLSNITSLYLTCPTGHQVIPGCNFCIYSVPCFCDMATDKIYFPPRLTHCVKANNASKVYPVNLAMLNHFYDQEQLIHIEADTMFDQPPLLPSAKTFNLFKHNLSDLIANDDAIDLNLRKIAHSIKNNKVVFQNLADPILDSLEDLDVDSLFNWNSILTLVNAAFSVCLLLALAYVYYKMRVMATALTLAAQANRVKTENPSNILNDKPNGVYILPTVPVPTEKLITYIPTYDDTIIYVLVTLVSINLAILLYKLLTRKLQHSTIALELSTGHRCITIPLINVPLCPKMYHYLARENFSHMKVEGWIRPMLLWGRGQITIVNFLDHSELQIPQKIFVSFWQGIKLRIILKQLVYCYVIVLHGSHVLHVKVCPVTCTTCEPVSLTVATAPTDQIDQIPLYPRLSDTEIETENL